MTAAMNRLRTLVEVFCWRHGLTWALSAFVVAVASLAAAWALEPRRQQVADLATRLDQAQAAARAAPSVAPPRPASDEVEALLRSAPDPAHSLQRMAALAQEHQVVSAQTEYQQSTVDGIGVLQLQVNQPVKATYPQLRGYVEAVLQDIPNATLDQITARRDSVGQSQLDTRLRWSLWAMPGPLKPKEGP